MNRLFKLSEGRPHVIDMIKNDEIDLIINTPSGKTPRKDEVKIRSTGCRAPNPDPHHHQWRRSKHQGNAFHPNQGTDRKVPAGVPSLAPEAPSLEIWSRADQLDAQPTKHLTLTPMHSMTGYGRGQVMSEGTKVIAEIQSVNKRQTEILINLPVRARIAGK